MKYVKLFEQQEKEYSIYDVITMTSYTAYTTLSKELMPKKQPNISLIKDILKHSPIDINSTEWGEPILLTAMSNKHLEAMRTIIEHPDIDINLTFGKYKDTVLIQYIKRDLTKEEVIKLLLEHPKINIDYQNSKGRTALMIACHNVDPKVIFAFLDSYADVNLQDLEGKTAFMELCEFGDDYLVIEMLSQANVDVNIQDNEGISALHRACIRNEYNMVRDIMNHNGNVNLKTIYDSTSLMFASRYGHAQIIERLFWDKTIKVNEQDVSGDTALIQASGWGKIDAVNILLKHPNIDVTLTNKKGYTAWDVATEEIKKEFIKLNPNAL